MNCHKNQNMPNAKPRFILEAEKIKACIKDANGMQKLADDIDKTPAQVTKFKSRSKSSYKILFDN